MRVFIACSDERLRLALHLLIDEEPGMFVAGLADRTAGLLAQLTGSEPDVLLFDWETARAGGTALLKEIRQLERPPAIIVLTGKQEEKERILAAGACHVIYKDAPPDELIPVLTGLRRPPSFVA